MAGLWFEEFEVGQVFRHEVRRTVTDMDNILFSSLTYNPAALHIDHAYAATTEFGKPLMNSLFTLGLVIGLSVLDTTFGSGSSSGCRCSTPRSAPPSPTWG
jgi:acyl dehydratase